MEKKQSFYKSQHEKDLARVVDNFYNDAIGGNENSYMDGTVYHAYTEEELVAEIIKSILYSKESLRLEDTIWVLEPKHIRFMGKKESVKSLAIESIIDTTKKGVGYGKTNFPFLI